ncbi:sugar O-acetyltransferase [uncultured Anaerofustis sp.]|uniref:sugar O-acetyltransferase n=1 Tax=uncultured Anaerofustis sp. TaxID=904996 RepID=UPI0025D53918|nr:sugar O-acetyltransferase [uncultured Anaerofustis sp.]
MDKIFSEYDKMINELEYIQNKELMDLLLENKKLMDKYNNLGTTDIEKRKNILKDMLGYIHESVDILPPFICDYGKNISIDKHSFINHNCTILAEANVVIGKYVRIAPNVSIYTVGHAENPLKRKAGYSYAKKVIIEDNVWIGGNVIILPGVTIGENSIIGAGSVINKSIPQNVIAAGNPCKIIKEIEE